MSQHQMKSKKMGLERKAGLERAVSVHVLRSDCTSNSPPPQPNLLSAIKLKCHQQFDETAQRKGSINRHARIFFFSLSALCSDAIIQCVTETSWPFFRAGKLLSTSSKCINRTLPTSKEHLGNKQSAFCS